MKNRNRFHTFAARSALRSVFALPLLLNFLGAEAQAFFTGDSRYETSPRRISSGRRCSPSSPAIS